MMKRRPGKRRGPKPRLAAETKRNAVIAKYDDAQFARLKEKAGTQYLAAYVREKSLAD